MHVLLQRRRRPPKEALSAGLAAAVLAALTQLALAAVPAALPSISLVAMLPFAGVVLTGELLASRLLRRMIGVRGSAPAFVCCSILILWGVHLLVIRKSVSLMLSMILNAECTLLLLGLYRIFLCDPGVVYSGSSVIDEASCRGLFYAVSQGELPSARRVRYCSSCKANISGFDHHCPAFGNCIGQKNYRLFVILLAGFVITEATYTMCSCQYISGSINAAMFLTKSYFSVNMVIGTMLFCVLQVIWQVLFLIWHIYCICFNIRTDEWVAQNLFCQF